MGLDIANIGLATLRKFVSICVLILLKSSSFLSHQSDDDVVGSHTYFWSCFRVVYKSSTKCFEGENKMRKLSPTYNTSTLQNTLILILYVHATVGTVHGLCAWMIMYVLCTWMLVLQQAKCVLPTLDKTLHTQPIEKGRCYVCEVDMWVRYFYSSHWYDDLRWHYLLKRWY